MLETDTNRDDFKDDMMEVKEDYVAEKVSGDGPDDDDQDDVKAVEGADSEGDEPESKSKQNSLADKEDPSEEFQEEIKDAVENQSKAFSKAVLAFVILLVIGIGVFLVTHFMDNSIVGTWEFTVEDSDNATLQNAKMVFTFDDDGKCEADSYLGDVIFYSEKGTYSTKSGYLSLEWEKQGKVDDVKYSVSGDELTFFNKNDTKQIFKKVKE